MKQFCCGDVVPGCSSVWTDEDEQSILQAVAAHAHADHGLTEIPPELVHTVRSHIRDVA